MMNRNVILYIASSLDGYIAKKDSSVDFLEGDRSEPGADNGYASFFKSIDTVIMGRRTYEQIVTELSPETWPYPGVKGYVASSKYSGATGDIKFVNGNFSPFINSLKSQEGKDIWLVGGSQLIDTFIKEDLIDMYIITIIPTILGSGIPLFLGHDFETKLKLIGTRHFDGMVELCYVKR